MPPDPTLTTLLTAAAASPPASRVETTAAAIQARCWNRSALSAACSPPANVGDTLAAALGGAGIEWNPQWLIDAGYTVADAGGLDLTTGAAATTPGNIVWTPSIDLPRVTDKPADSAAATQPEMRIRFAGEVGVLALWRAAANLSASRKPIET